MSTIGYVASCVMDLTFEVDDFPQTGETVVTDQFHTGYGGKGANQAVAAAKTGADVRVTGAVGSDEFGRGTIENFHDHGIDTEYLVTMDQAGTGLASISVDGDGDNIIAVAPRANNKLSQNHIKDIPDEWFNLSYMVGVNEISEQVLVEAFGRSKQIGSPEVVLNAAPARSLPDMLWDFIDCLIVNESEAEYYLGEDYDRDRLETVTGRLLDRGPNRVIVTLGSEGSVYADRDRMITRRSPSIDAVDTTGAGDAFVGAYLSARSRDLGPGDALDRANRYAAESVTSEGTQKSFPEHI